MVSLERKVTPGGRPKIQAPPGQHDDEATVLMALVLELAGVEEPGLIGYYRRLRADAADPVAALQRKLAAERARQPVGAPA
jgi:hypothetical protein